MKTTLNFDDALIKAAKVRAAKDGKTLTRLIEEALHGYLEPAPEPKPKKPFKLKLLTKKGGLLPGVDLDSRNSWYDLFEERF